MVRGVAARAETKQRDGQVLPARQGLLAGGGAGDAAARARASAAHRVRPHVRAAARGPVAVDLSRAARVALALSALRRIGGGISARYAEIYLPWRAKPIRL